MISYYTCGMTPEGKRQIIRTIAFDMEMFLRAVIPTLFHGKATLGPILDSPQSVFRSTFPEFALDFREAVNYRNNEVHPPTDQPIEYKQAELTPIIDNFIRVYLVAFMMRDKKFEVPSEEWFIGKL